jgi:hypothetical protein
MIFEKDKNDEDNYIVMEENESFDSNKEAYDLNNILINKVGQKSTPF